MSQITPAPAGVLVFCVDSVVFWNLGVVVPLDELDAHAAPTRDVLPGLVVDGVPAASLVLVATPHARTRVCRAQSRGRPVPCDNLYTPSRRPVWSCRTRQCRSRHTMTAVATSYYRV